MSEEVEILLKGAAGTEEKRYFGRHIEKEGVHNLFYRGENGPCRITVASEEALIRREGEALPELRIRAGELTEAVLSQSFGTLSFQLKGRKILTRKLGNGLLFELSYTLLQGGKAVSENLVRIQLRPRS